MILCYVASPAPLPPTPSALLHEVAEWQARVAGESDPVWDSLRIAAAPTEVRLQFTLGQGVPSAVLEWMPWAGRGLDNAAREVLEAPAATLRLEVEGISPSPSEALKGARFVGSLGAAVARLLGGVLLDVAAQRFWAGADLTRFDREDLDVRDYVSVHAEPGTADRLYMHTHGMVRFGRPDLEISEVPMLALPFATQALNEAAQHQALGSVLRVGDRLVVDDYQFSLTATVRGRDHCGNEVLALVDPPEAPQRDVMAPRNTMARFCLDVGGDVLNDGRPEEALRWLDAAAALAPHRGDAWRGRAAALEALGRTHEAAADLARAEALEG